MHEEQKSVFISYRRKPAAYIARAIFMDLHAHGYDVFMDVENINAGEFGTIIDNQIKARAHFLIVLTTGTVGRFDEPKDWLRHEIEYAMEQKRNIVPLLIDGFKFNKTTKKYLTGKLDTLPSLNGLRVPHEYFDEAMEKLRTRFLKALEYVVTEPTPLNEQVEVERKIEEVAAQPPPTKAELSAEDYFNRAYQEVEAGNHDSAIADYSEAIRLNPLYAEAYNNRGTVRKAGDLEGAIADYTRSIELNNPELHLPYNNRGNARFDKGDLDGAIADYSEAIRLKPQLASAYNNRGNARQAKDDLGGAIADYSEAIRLNPKYVEAYYNRGNVRKAQGDFSGAFADHNEAIHLNPQSADAYNIRGNTRYDKGDLDGAFSDYNEAIRLNPQLVDAYYYRGITRVSKGDLSGAIEDFQAYLDLSRKRDWDQALVEHWIWNLQKQLKS